MRADFLLFKNLKNFLESLEDTLFPQKIAQRFTKIKNVIS
jgi:hypothetical protein